LALIKIAEKNKELLGEEVQRVDELDGIIGRIFGISKDEIVNG
jgi:hypothetical protein